MSQDSPKNIREIFVKLSKKENLTAEEAKLAATQVFGELKINEPISILPVVSFFGSLTVKETTNEELLGIAEAMEASRNFTFDFNAKKPLVTAGGTGGDTIPTINVTTTAIIVAAAAGAVALKSGSGAFSSKTGSADLAEALGINIYASKEVVKKCVDEIGVTAWASGGIYPWMFPLIELGSKKPTSTVMPLLYSLRFAIATGLNPFSLKRQVRGVSKPINEKIAQVWQKLGYEKALAVTGYGKTEGVIIDELSVYGKNRISELKTDGSIETYMLYPEDVGIKTASVIQEAAAGESHVENAKIVTGILSGKDHTSRRNLILLNAAAILYVADEVKTFKDGYERAMQAVDEGKALEKLKSLIFLSGGQTAKIEALLKQ